MRIQNHSPAIARLLAAGTLGMLCGGLAAPAEASDSVGVYAAIRKVKFEPDATSPTRVRVCGAFALANVNNASYFAPVAGYMYYSCTAGKEALCKMQWGELANASVTKKCVGYGQRRDSNFNPANNGTIHKPTEQPGTPDVYPIELGVIMPTTTDSQQVCPAAIAATVDTTPCEDAPATADMASPGPAQDLSAPATNPTSPGGKSCAYGQRSTGGAGTLLGGLMLLALALRRRLAARV